MKTPVLIVSGFLGTGKTTFIRQFLADVNCRMKLNTKTK